MLNLKNTRRELENTLLVVCGNCRSCWSVYVGEKCNNLFSLQEHWILWLIYCCWWLFRYCRLHGNYTSIKVRAAFCCLLRRNADVKIEILNFFAVVCTLHNNTNLPHYFDLSHCTLYQNKKIHQKLKGQLCLPHWHSGHQDCNNLKL